MISSFTLVSPEIVARVGKLDAWNKFMLKLSEALESIDQIGGHEYIRVFAEYPSSSDFYNMQLGFPLRVTYHLADNLGKPAAFQEDGHVRLYAKDGNYLGFVDLHPRDTVRTDDIDRLAADLSAAVLRQLQFQFAGVAA
ncbi:MAG: hypothetical protein AAB449_02530 [Patescibacteria group bacterium]